MKKKNVLFIVVDSVTNDFIFNRKNSNDIAPFLCELRKMSLTTDKMYSEAPFTEAALMSLFCSKDTMDNGGYLERFKNSKTIFEVFKENGYKTYFGAYAPNIYPSYRANGCDFLRNSTTYRFRDLWNYRIQYYADLYFKKLLTEDDYRFLVEIIDDNFCYYIKFLENILYDKNDELSMIIKHIDQTKVPKIYQIIVEEYHLFAKDNHRYIDNIFTEGKNHIIFKLETLELNDKVHDLVLKNKVNSELKKILKKVYKLNFLYNLKNNRFPFKKFIKSIFKFDNLVIKGLLAGYKNSLFDKDLFERSGLNYDSFKDAVSFRTVANEFLNWIDKDNLNEPFMSCLHVDDVHFKEEFFSYDSDNYEIINKEFSRINNYLNNIPSDYKGSITHDLSLIYADTIIKEIYDGLKKRKLLDDTIIVIASDHGFSYNFSPVREKYVNSTYYENYNSFFLLYNKDFAQRKIDKFCATKDIPSTIIASVGLSCKDFKGKNLLIEDGRDYVFLEYMGFGCPDFIRRPIQLGVRTDKYFVLYNNKLSLSFEQGIICEVYDLNNDYLQNNNISNSKNVKNLITNELSLLKVRFEELKKENEDFLNGEN